MEEKDKSQSKVKLVERDDSRKETKTKATDH